jgi:hypothetical protein
VVNLTAEGKQNVSRASVSGRSLQPLEGNTSQQFETLLGYTDLLSCFEATCLAAFAAPGIAIVTSPKSTYGYKVEITWGGSWVKHGSKGGLIGGPASIAKQKADGTHLANSSKGGLIGGSKGESKAAGSYVVPDGTNPRVQFTHLQQYYNLGTYPKHLAPLVHDVCRHLLGARRRQDCQHSESQIQAMVTDCQSEVVQAILAKKKLNDIREFIIPLLHTPTQVQEPPCPPP